MDCRGCGLCCNNSVYPYLDVELGETDYIPQVYTEMRDGKRWMRRKPNGDCIALSGKRRCTIYLARPKECRDFNQDHPICQKLLARSK